VVSYLVFQNVKLQLVVQRGADAAPVWLPPRRRFSSGTTVARSKSPSGAFVLVSRFAYTTMFSSSKRNLSESKWEPKNVNNFV